MPQPPQAKAFTTDENLFHLFCNRPAFNRVVCEIHVQGLASVTFVHWLPLIVILGEHLMGLFHF